VPGQKQNDGLEDLAHAMQVSPLSPKEAAAWLKALLG